MVTLELDLLPLTAVRKTIEQVTLILVNSVSCECQVVFLTN